MPGQSEVQRVSSFDEARRRIAARAENAGSAPQSCDSAFEQVLRNPVAAMPGLRERLVRRLGWGDQPEKRRRLYDKLCKLHAANEAVVEELISIAWMQAQGARFRDRYFCKAILGLLADRGLSLAPEGGPGDERF
jgi:hypothetical protein